MGSRGVPSWLGCPLSLGSRGVPLNAKRAHWTQPWPSPCYLFPIPVQSQDCLKLEISRDDYAVVHRQRRDALGL
jgi:hypothetical protein